MTWRSETMGYRAGHEALQEVDENGMLLFKLSEGRAAEESDEGVLRQNCGEPQPILLEQLLS